MKQLTWIVAGLALIVTVSCQNNSQGVDKSAGEDKLGNEQGNGTDNVPYGFGAAWVLGPNAIRYCTVIAGDFGVSAAQVNAEVESAFSIWREYIQTKKINENLRTKYIETLAARYPKGAPPEVMARANLFVLSTTASPMSICDGTENVKFYFGVVDDLILKLKQNYFNPTAFAFRTDYDSQSGSGKGVVWLVKQGGLDGGKGGYPDWTLANRLRGVLLHEIGHVYGVGHFDDTIMREDMWALLLGSKWTTEDQAKIEYQMGHIDHDVELFFPALADNTTTYKGFMSFYGSLLGSASRPEVEESFEFLTGRKPVGDVVSQFTRQKLTVFDSQSSFDFDVALDTQHGGVIGKSIFKVERTWPFDADGLGGAGLSLNHVSLASAGVIRTKNGIAAPVTLLQNLGPGPLRMTYLQDGKEKALLIMDRL